MEMITLKPINIEHVKQIYYNENPECNLMHILFIKKALSLSCILFLVSEEAFFSNYTMS